MPLTHITNVIVTNHTYSENFQCKDLMIQNKNYIQYLRDSKPLLFKNKNSGIYFNETQNKLIQIILPHQKVIPAISFHKKLSPSTKTHMTPEVIIEHQNGLYYTRENSNSGDYIEISL